MAITSYIVVRPSDTASTTGIEHHVVAVDDSTPGNYIIATTPSKTNATVVAAALNATLA